MAHRLLPSRQNLHRLTLQPPRKMGLVHHGNSRISHRALLRFYPSRQTRSLLPILLPIISRRRRRTRSPLRKLDNDNPLHNPLHLPRNSLPLTPQPLHVSHPPHRIFFRFRLASPQRPFPRRLVSWLWPHNRIRLGRKIIYHGNWLGHFRLGVFGKYFS